MANVIAIPFVPPFKRSPTSSSLRRDVGADCHFDALGTQAGRRSIEPTPLSATRLGEDLPTLELADSKPRSMPLCCRRIYVRRCFGAASYGLVPPPEDVPPFSSLFGEGSPPPPVTPPGSVGFPPPVAGGDGAAACVAGEFVVGEFVAGELSALRCAAVSPGSNLLPELRSSRDVCGVPFGSSSDLGISGVGVGAGGGAGLHCSAPA